ncbi:MAG: lipopolysaccharide heptosyltransferase I [Sutterellaceae bacterium]|nr:lipopolysaccharide heptosyltransferase I [Sutterellaceae bacterium]
MSKKILIIKSSSMGDVVHALPVAYDIKQALPDCQLHWVVEESFADIVTLSPWIDKHITTAFRRWRKTILKSDTRREIAEVKAELQAEKYDIVIDLQGLMRSALVARWTKADTVGYSKDTIREPLASYLYRRTECVPESLTPVLRYRTMASRVLGYPINEKEPRFGLKVAPVTPAGVTGEYAALAVNTSRPEKLWPQSRWIEVAKALKSEGMQSVFFWGNEQERLRVEEIASAVEGLVVMPRSNIRALAQAIAGAKCLLGVDTGFSHLGAALGVPSVGIIVGTSAELFRLVSEGACATVGDKGVIPQPEEVLAALASVMDESRQKKGK